MPVSFNTGMKVANDFLMPKLTMFILPASVCIQPKDGLISADDYFGVCGGHCVS